MSKLVIGSLEEFQQYVGHNLGHSEELTITQEQINKFAEATIDHQWIHTDPEKAKEGSQRRDNKTIRTIGMIQEIHKNAGPSPLHTHT